MARQWRIQYPGALYHVLSRGNDHQDIFLSEKDKQSFLEIIGELTERFSVEAYAFVLMDNHYHLLLKTFQPNLSKAKRDRMEFLIPIHLKLDLESWKVCTECATFFAAQAYNQVQVLYQKIYCDRCFEEKTGRF